MSFTFPTVCLEEVFHYGTLDPSRRGERFRGSYEGHGLSVTTNPQAWRKIAKLGGEPLWSLRKQGGRFLDAHALSSEQQAAIKEWALASGYAEEIDSWQVVYYDSELDLYLAMLRTSAEAAAEEAEAFGDLFERIEQVKSLRGTARFCQETGLPAEHGQEDQLLSLYVAEQTDLDGVWWADEESHLTAARGCICPNKLNDWNKEKIEP